MEAARVSKIAEQQRRDPELGSIVQYVEDGTIPQAWKLARKLVTNVLDLILLMECYTMKIQMLKGNRGLPFPSVGERR